MVIRGLLPSSRLALAGLPAWVPVAWRDGLLRMAGRGWWFFPAFGDCSHNTAEIANLAMDTQDAAVSAN
jgi:hypothetical protein